MVWFRVGELSVPHLQARQGGSAQGNEATLAAARLRFSDLDMLLQKIDLAPSQQAQFLISDTGVDRNQYGGVE